jgi:hypothetical protein
MAEAQLRVMTFLLIVVIVMSAALVAEICAFIGLALVARRAARNAAVLQRELSEKFHPTMRIVEELKIGLAPRLQTIQSNATEVAALVSNRARVIKAIGQDTHRRAELLRLRVNNEGIQTVEQLRQGETAVRGGILPPIQTLRKVLRGFGIAIWLLRRVA